MPFPISPIHSIASANKGSGMAVKAYFIHRAKDSPPIPRHLRGLTGPYLFRSEAEQYSQVISAASGVSCQISTIEVRRILGDVVCVGTRLIIADVWNIKSTQSGFSAEVLIQGKLCTLHREGPGDTWHCAEQRLLPDSD
jgi:hypothetical protein